MRKIKYLIFDDGSFEGFAVPETAEPRAPGLMAFVFDLSKASETADAAAPPETEPTADDPAPEASEAEVTEAEVTEAANTAASALAPQPVVERLGINVYKSSEHAFALGHKTYANASEAKSRQTPNGSWWTSFDLFVDFAHTRVAEANAWLFGGGAESRFFYVLHDGGDIKLSHGYDERPSDPSPTEAVCLIEVAVRQDGTVAVRNA